MYRITSGGGKRGKARISYYRCSGRGANRKGCGNLIRVDAADAAMRQIAETTFAWTRVTVTVHVPGSAHEAELAEVAFELAQLSKRNLTDEQEDAERTRLRAERDQLKALPATADEWVETELDESWADRWNAVEPAERGDWLKAQGFRVEASRDRLRLTQPGHPREVTATVTLTGGKAA